MTRGKLSHSGVKQRRKPLVEISAEATTAYNILIVAPRQGNVHLTTHLFTRRVSIDRDRLPNRPTFLFIHLKMSTHATDATIEPKVETADAGPKLAATETKLATEPLHGSETGAKSENDVEEKKETTGVVAVSYLPLTR